MPKEFSYTIEEVSQLLKVSKLTLYDMVKKGDIPVFRVGRQMRIDTRNLDVYIKNHKTKQTANFSPFVPVFSGNNPNTIIISGQDMVLDILCKYIEKNSVYDG